MYACLITWLIVPAILRQRAQLRRVQRNNQAANDAEIRRAAAEGDGLRFTTDLIKNNTTKRDAARWRWKRAGATAKVASGWGPVLSGWREAAARHRERGDALTV